MKHILIVVALFAIAVAAAAAQGTPAAPKLDTVDQILDRFVAAVGGPALQKVTSAQLRGTVEIVDLQVNGTVELSQKAPDKALQVVAFDQMGTQREGFDGTVGWAEDPQNGVREKTGAELADARRGAVFPRELMLKKIYPKMTVTGREKVGEREAFVINAAPPDGEPARLYFDVESGLLLRQVVTRQSPQGPVIIDATLEDYRPVDGVKRPFVIRQVTPQFKAVIRFTEIKHNVAFDDAIFKKPS
jgi:hypothetical protein